MGSYNERAVTVEMSVEEVKFLLSAIPSLPLAGKLMDLHKPVLTGLQLVEKLNKALEEHGRTDSDSQKS